MSKKEVVYKIEVTNTETGEVIFVETFIKIALLFPIIFTRFKDGICDAIFVRNK